MNNIEIIYAVFGGTLTVVIFILMYVQRQRDNKFFKEQERLREECSSYLDTCFKRACLTTSTDSLEMLWEEMSKSKEHYTYHRDNLNRFITTRAFIRGKYWGLLRREQLLKNP